MTDPKTVSEQSAFERADAALDASRAENDALDKRLNRSELRVLRLHGVRAYLPMLWHYWRWGNMGRYKDNAERRS